MYKKECLNRNFKYNKSTRKCINPLAIKCKKLDRKYRNGKCTKECLNRNFKYNKSTRKCINPLAIKCKKLGRKYRNGKCTKECLNRNFKYNKSTRKCIDPISSSLVKETPSPAPVVTETSSQMIKQKGPTIPISKKEVINIKKYKQDCENHDDCQNHLYCNENKSYNEKKCLKKRNIGEWCNKDYDSHDCKGDLKCIGPNYNDSYCKEVSKCG